MLFWGYTNHIANPMPNSDFGETFFGNEAEKESHQRTDHTGGNGQVQKRGNCGNRAIDADDTEDDAEENVEESFHLLYFLVLHYYYCEIRAKLVGYL